MLEEGEPLVEVFPLEHGKFLCKKAKVLHISNQSPQAIEALEQAKTLAQDIDAGEDSELGKVISETEEFISSHPIRPTDK